MGRFVNHAVSQAGRPALPATTTRPQGRVSANPRRQPGQPCAFGPPRSWAGSKPPPPSPPCCCYRSCHCPAPPWGPPTRSAPACPCRQTKTQAPPPTPALPLLPVLSLPWAALGATDPIGSGLAWLQSQILSDGQLSRASALVAPTQARCETAKTLLRLSGSGPAVVTLISTLPSDASTSTQALVCQSHLHRLLGSIANAGLAERSVAGGGYSAYPGQTGTDGGASLLDTGWALHSQWQSLTPAELADTIAWLRTRQHPDGSFAQGPGAELMTTASILLGL